MLWWVVGLSAAVCALGPAYVAERKGRDWFWWWAAGIVALPVAVVVAFYIDPLPGDRWQRCPHCFEFARAGATVCRHCGRDI